MRNDINFFESIMKDKSLKKLDFKKLLRNTLILSVAGCLLYYFSIFLLVSVDRAQIRELNDELASLATPWELDEIERTKQHLGDLNIENQMFITYLKEFEESPTLYVSDIENIASLQPADLTIDSFSYGENNVRLGCSSRDQLAGAYFAHLLRTSGIFENVDYTGVSGSGEKYSFAISFDIRREGAATEEVETDDVENE